VTIAREGWQGFGRVAELDLAAAFSS